MITKVVMPMLGWTMKEGTIVTWLKKEGEGVEKGEPLLEVETGKVLKDIESPGTGILRIILIPEESTVPVTEILAIIAEPQEDIPDLQNMIEKAKVLLESPEATSIEKSEDRIIKKRPVKRKISPVAKKIAEKNNIDFNRITGTGPNGRIVRKDVFEFIEMTKYMPRVKEVIKLTGIRKITADRLSFSYRTAVHVTITMAMNMLEMVKLRHKLLPEIEKKVQSRVTYTDMLVKVLAQTLEEYPILNSTLEDEEIKILENINIGIAVDTGIGLVVPVVREANKKSLTEIALLTRKLIEKARSGNLALNEATGGSFTITNLGMFGIDQGTPIINPPEIAILGVGRIAEKPVVIDGRVEIRPMMNITLSFDHRVIDGALAARFLQNMKQKIEKPYEVFKIN
jgi:pyruvate dehydrogenase E2 component (dihydrolipoamide acetyltransferase)